MELKDLEKEEKKVEVSMVNGRISSISTSLRNDLLAAVRYRIGKLSPKQTELRKSLQWLCFCIDRYTFDNVVMHSGSELYTAVLARASETDFGFMRRNKLLRDIRRLKKSIGAASKIERQGLDEYICEHSVAYANINRMWQTIHTQSTTIDGLEAKLFDRDALIETQSEKIGRIALCLRESDDLVRAQKRRLYALQEESDAKDKQLLDFKELTERLSLLASTQEEELKRASEIIDSCAWQPSITKPQPKPRTSVFFDRISALHAGDKPDSDTKP